MVLKADSKRQYLLCENTTKLHAEVDAPRFAFCPEVESIERADNFRVAVSGIA